MNFVLSFSFIFQDKGWLKKLLLPGLCLLIPVVGWLVVLGWALKVTKNIVDGMEQPLPELEFGSDLSRGFFGFLISFIYSLPVSILSSLGSWIGNWFYFDNEIASVLIAFVTGSIGLLAFIVGFLTFFLTLTAIATYAVNDDFSAAFRFTEVFSLLKKNIGDWLLVAVGMLLALGLIAPLGTVACIIGVVITLTYSLAVSGHLLGQAYYRSNVN